MVAVPAAYLEAMQDVLNVVANDLAKVQARGAWTRDGGSANQEAKRRLPLPPSQQSVNPFTATDSQNIVSQAGVRPKTPLSMPPSRPRMPAERRASINRTSFSTREADLEYT